MKKVLSVRLEEWLADEVSRLAKAQGMTPSMLIRQLVEQGVNNQNVLADYVTLESERVEKMLMRIESAVVGHMHFSTVVAPKADKSEFMKALIRGRKVVDQLNEIESSED